MAPMEFSGTNAVAPMQLSVSPQDLTVAVGPIYSTLKLWSSTGTVLPMVTVHATGTSGFTPIV